MNQLNVPAEIEKLLCGLIMAIAGYEADDLSLGDKAEIYGAVEVLLSLIEQVCNELIGDDEPTNPYSPDGHDENQLRAAQRQTLATLLKGEKE